MLLFIRPQAMRIGFLSEVVQEKKDELLNSERSSV